MANNNPKKVKQTPQPPLQQSGVAPKAQAVAAAAPAAPPSARLLLVILAVISFLVYSNTFGNDYVLDDLMVAPGNSYVQKGFEGIPMLLTTPYMQGYVKMPNDNYRPLSPVTLAIERQLLGINPGTSHIVNVLLYLMGVCLLFYFLMTVAGPKYLSVIFAAALLFAVHPLHTEVVANIKSRDELLCFMLAMAALNAFFKYRQTGKMPLLLAGGLLYFGSLLSKETSISLVVLLPVIFFGIGKGDKAKSMVITIAGLVAAFAFLVIRYSILKANHADNSSYMNFMDNQLVTADAATRFGTATLVLGHYLRLLLIPAPLICTYAYNTIPATGLANIWVILTLLVYASNTVYAVFRLVKQPSDLLAFAILFGVANLAIFSNYFILIGSVMSERFLFFASVGFCIAVPILLQKIPAFRTGNGSFWGQKLWWVVVPIAMVYGGLTYARNTDWKDNMTLFTADLKKVPENARLNYYLGNEMGTAYANSAGDINTKARIVSESLPYLRKAVAIYPGFNEALTTLGTALFNLAQYDSAEVYLQKALHNDSLNVLALNGLAGIYFMKQDFPHARDILIRDVAINPNNTSIVHNLGLCYLNMRVYDSCIYYGRKVLVLTPQHLETLKDMTKAFVLTNQTDSAARYLKLVQAQDPNFKL